MTTRIRPPVKWHGGKHYLAKRIIELFPEHHTYVEPYGGCASVLLNREPSSVEVYNDMDFSIFNLFWVLRNRPCQFSSAIALTPYHEHEFNEDAECTLAQMEVTRQEHGVEKARRDYVRWRQSFGGQGRSFCPTLHRVRRGMADNVSGWLSSIDDNLPLVIERLRTVQILNRDALDVIRTWDSPETLFYCDPPYLHETRASTDVYGREMSGIDHLNLLSNLMGIKGRVILSGYPSGMYRDVLRTWRTKTFDLPNNAAGGKTKARKTETIWMNW